MKKFLCFFGAVLVLLAMCGYTVYKYVIPKDYPVFIESFEHGMMSIDSDETFGKDNKFEIFCKKGEKLTININPERTGNSYYNLDKLIVNDVDVTDDVNMLEYKLEVKGKTTVLAYFKKSKNKAESSSTSTSSVLKAPEIFDYAKNEYFGSANAYNIEDPAVVYDLKTDYYYCFASNNVVMKSKDLQNWEKRTNYFKVPSNTETKDLMDFSQFDSVKSWAKDHGYSSDETVSTKTNNRVPSSPELIKIKDTYYLYFTLSKESNANESAIFCVKTNNLEEAVINKQWDDVGLVICSCGHNATSADNSNYEAVNCVAPSVFTNKQSNKLYMAYGSYFGEDNIKGSINLVELDMDTGLLKKDSSINSSGSEISKLHGSVSFKSGVQLANPGRIPAMDKDSGSLVSNVDIIYNSSNEYYYMFITYGVSETNYEIRTARSKDPDGPYLDFNGNDMASFGKTASNNQYSKGTPFISGYNFIMSSSGGVSYSDVGKASIGSPSIIRSTDGAWLMASQSRCYYKIDGSIYCGDSIAKENDIEAETKPALELRQIFFKNDWPLPVSEPYNNEKTDQEFTKAMLNGHWDAVIFDGKAPNGDYDSVVRYTSVKFSLFNSFAITEKSMNKKQKLDSSTFKKINGTKYSITIDGTEYIVYPSYAWDNELDCETIVFSGFDEKGNVIMAKKNFNSYTGIYLDVFEYLVDIADSDLAESYKKKLEKISDNPTQETIDKYCSQLCKKIVETYK